MEFSAPALSDPADHPARRTPAAYLFGRTSQFTVLATTLFGYWMCIAVGDAASRAQVIAWAGLFGLVQALRIAHFVNLAARPPAQVPALYMFGNALGGAFFGVGAAWAYVHGDPGIAAAAVAGVCGLCATSVAMFGGRLSAVWTYTAPMMLPPIATALLAGQPHGWAVSMTMLIGWICTLGSGRQVARSIASIVEGRQRNAVLAAETQRQKDELLLLNRQVQLQAEHDALTGLLNRRGYTRATGAAMKQCENLALVVIDLDGFKPINDTFGHDAGDAVLVEMAKRIRAVTRSGDIAARTGGDEFIVVLSRLSSAEVIEAFCARLVHALCRPCRVGEADIGLGASVGVAMGSGPVPLDELEKVADAAMYRSKRRGGCVPEIVSVQQPGRP